MKVHFDGGFEKSTNSDNWYRKNKVFHVNWDGNTLEDALENLKKTAEKEWILQNRGGNFFTD